MLRGIDDAGVAGSLGFSLGSWAGAANRVLSRAADSRGTIARATLLVLLVNTVGVSALHAKEVGPGGVLVYAGPGGPGYVQFADLLVNGKMEWRGCGAPTLDKNGYKNLPKLASNQITSLERLPDGSMQAEMTGQPARCVVPANFKFEKDTTMSMSELIDKSSFTAQVTGSDPAGMTALPPPSPGAKFFFGVNNDAELAQYLVATRASTMAQWRVYLSKNGLGAHAAEGKKALEALLLTDGQNELKAYRTAKKGAPAYAHLKVAQQRVSELLTLDPAGTGGLELRTGVQAELTALSDSAQANLKIYRSALADHTKGFTALAAAREPADAAFDVDPKFAAGAAVHADVAKETTTFENDLLAAQAKLKGQRYDDAYDAVKRYSSFAEEEFRLNTVVQAVYKYHMDHGAQLEAAGQFGDAVKEYTKAHAIVPTDASTAALAKAGAGLLSTQNKAAADAALAKSQEYVTAQDPIKAYEVLLDLNPAQRQLVTDAMATLQPMYVTAATDMARKLQQTHTPIKGRADENAVRQAYTYLERVNTMDDNPDVKVRLDLLSDAISSYYVALAQKYLAKPVGSGVGLGWSYLDEAAQYQPGLSTIRDEKAKASATYQMRSKLSVKVEFLDQTSRRDSVGFAEQLQDSIATGLETSRLPVRVIRPSAAPVGVEPNFKLRGEILQHRPIQKITTDTMKSNYRFGEREIPNPAWNKADQDYQDAQVALTKAQSDEHVMQLKNNKKLSAEAAAAVDAAQKKASAARATQNNIPKTLQEDVIRPYTYTKRIYDITNIVELSFRIVDANNNLVEESTSVKREVPKKFTVLESIKPDDTEGVKDIDAPPDSSQLMTDVEIAARDELVKLAHDKVVGLPLRILNEARGKVKSEDSDAAAELYILYLNSTTPQETPERLEAIHFLNDVYNIRHAASLSASGQ